MSAKDIVLKPIPSREARDLVRRVHYSGKVDPRSQLSIGVYWQGSLEGALMFGPSIDKRKTIGLVRDTPWNGYLELNRMAFTDRLPRNSESRALSISMKMLRKYAPHVQWVLSYADATQCGDGTIYRASGFLLTGIKENDSIWQMPDGEVVAKIIFEPGFQPNAGENSMKARYGKSGSESAGRFLKRIGARPLVGHQIRYIYPIDPTVKSRLTVPILPYTTIETSGAKMYRGERASEA